jgi:hypothetical protein
MLVIVELAVQKSGDDVGGVALEIEDGDEGQDDFKGSRAGNRCVGFAPEVRLLAVAADDKACLETEEITIVVKLVLVHPLGGQGEGALWTTSQLLLGAVLVM